MTHDRMLRTSERWFRLLRNFYPADFRDEMGGALVEAYLDRARQVLQQGGKLQLAWLWLAALIDSLRNGAAERARPAASWRRTGNWGRDLEFVTRRLMRAPGFALTAIGTLTVGLGMFAVVYTAVKKVMLDPMPYKNPGDLYYVWRDYRPIADLHRGGLGGPDIVELQKAGEVIEGAAGLQPFLGGIFSQREGAEPMEIAVTKTSANLFDLLGIAPALGRAFTRDEIGPGRGQVIILTDRLWRRLGATPEIVGSDVRLQGRPFRVIGVLPAGFAFVRNDAVAPPQHVDAYIPFDAPLANMDPQYGGLACLLRARHGASLAAVAASVGAIGRGIDARDFHGRGLKLYPVELKTDVISRVRPALIVLGTAGVVLVLMLTLNLASLLLARSAQRAHEVAVSRALGANTIAIARSTLFEGGLLGLAGGAFGALAASWGAKALAALAPLDLPRREAISVDGSVAVFVILVGGLLGVLAAISPSVWAARTPLSLLLAGSAVRGGGGHSRLRRGMVVTQVALSLVLLSSAALVVRSFQGLLRADPGFRPDGVLTVRLRIPPEFVPKLSSAFEFQERVQQALAAIPGVTGASAASVLPLTAGARQATISVPGASGNTGDAGRDQLTADMIGVRANYVEVMGMRLRAGRGFGAARPNGVTEAIIDTAIAARYFPARNAVGAVIQFGGRPFTVIGVVDQARLYNVHTDGRPQIFVRSEDFGIRPLYFVMRTSREPRSLLPDVRSAVHGIDPRVPLGEARTMDEIVEASRSPESVGAVLIGAFAAGALLLAAIGLYGVISGSVTRRRHELAVRLALGAGDGRVLRLVLREAAVLAGAGLVIGAPGIYLAKSVIGGLLVGVSPFDPLTLAAAAAALLLVAMAACFVPARRALAIEPAQLLRQE